MASYLFQAKGIQRWILEGSRLAEIKAASALLGNVARSDGKDLVETALQQTGFTPSGWNRRAGGAFSIRFEQTDVVSFQRFRRLFCLGFSRLLPGLEFEERLNLRGDDPFSAEAVCNLARLNGTPTVLPFGHMLTRPDRRTGRPILGGEQVDQIRHAKQRGRKLGDALGDQILSACGQQGKFQWPDIFDAKEAQTNPRAIGFPWGKTQQWLAVIHADISGLGAFYAQLQGNAERARLASQAIEESVWAAVGDATRDHLLPDAEQGVLPARPILVGGDDVTIIVRGDLAFEFTQTFLQQLTVYSAKKLSAIEGLAGQLGLTAGAGISLGGAKQPFFRLLAQAEALCGHAKASAKVIDRERPPSVLSFNRITQSVVHDDPEALFSSVCRPEGQYALSMQPYALDKLQLRELPAWCEFESLRTLLDEQELGTSIFRELKTELMQSEWDQAELRWNRWREVTRKRNAAGLERFDKALGSLIGRDVGNRLASIFDSNKRTCVFDVIEREMIK